MKGGQRAFLFGLRDDGSPTCHPMVALEANGAPAFNTYRKSAKTRNFRRDPRAAAVLLDDWQESPATARIVKGVMEEIDPMLPSESAEGSVDPSLLNVPGSVKSRVQRRVDTGKRLYLRLKTDG